MKLPFTLGVKFIFRIVLPGFVLSLGFLPILRTLVRLLDGLIAIEYLFIISVLILGWLFVILDMPIYMVFEGRRYWPRGLRRILTKREQKRLEELEQVARQFRTADPARYREASVEIRRFPLNESDAWEAQFPTRLGNLLTSYEEYSKQIYGMWQGFYWPRIWLTLDKDLREEIDSRQALADSALYTVFALYICAALSFFYAILYLFNFQFISYLPRAPYVWILPVLATALGYFIYRQSLHVHAQFGETFKAVFDLHGYKVMFPQIVEAIAAASDNKQLQTASVEAQNSAVWVYLANFRIRCPHCDKTVRAAEIKGHSCVSPTTTPAQEKKSAAKKEATKKR